MLDGLEVHHLRFTCTPVTLIRFGPQAGAQIRGALWEVLYPMLGDTTLFKQLIELETASARGQNPARPFSVRPPLKGDPGRGCAYDKDEPFQFGISLFGTMIDLFPYMVQAVHEMGLIGVGYGRGQFMLDGVAAVNPLTGVTQTLLEDRQVTGLPAHPVTAAHIQAYAHALNQKRITLHFLTPTQITVRGRISDMPEFAPLIARLLERCQMIATNYGAVATPPETWREQHLALANQAKQVRMTRSNTRWKRVRSGSRRDNQSKKLSGFAGHVTFSGRLTPFLPWLLWGQSLQVGKNTVKGNGWYEVL